VYIFQGMGWRAKFLPGQLRRPHKRGELWDVSMAVFTQNVKGELCVIKSFRQDEDKYKGENYQLLKTFAFDPAIPNYWKEGQRILLSTNLAFNGGEYYDISNIHPASMLANEIASLWSQRRITKNFRVGCTFIWQKNAVNSNGSNNLQPMRATKSDDGDVSHVLVERYFRDYRIWNSNSGWNDNSSPWGKVMQAVSHFSYHASSGKLLICDLQGGFHSGNKEAREPNEGPTIVSPAFCSVKNNLGISDLGIRGIHTFFYRHKCNEYCNKDWLKPKGNKEKGKKYSRIIIERKTTTYLDVQKKKYI